MRSLLAWSVLAALGSTGALAAVHTTQGDPDLGPSGGPALNLLENGGFERWDNGVSSVIGPARWYAQGDPRDTFSQTAIGFDRVPSGELDGPPWALQATANELQGFVAQALENPAELASRTVTFSVDLRTPLSVALPRIEIHDGMTASASTLVAGPAWQRLTVRHVVAENPTRLEFRIYPDQTVHVDGAMAVVGRTTVTGFDPSSDRIGIGSSDVPLGTVIDWNQFHPSVPVPLGYALCDGSLITDPESPFFGFQTPDLRNRVVRGTTWLSEVRTTGGADTAAVSHDHDMAHTHRGWTTQPFNAPCKWVLKNPIGLLEAGALCDHTHDVWTDSGTKQRTSPTALTIPTIPRFIRLLKIVRIK